MLILIQSDQVRNRSMLKHQVNHNQNQLNQYNHHHQVLYQSYQLLYHHQHYHHHHLKSVSTQVLILSHFTNQWWAGLHTYQQLMVQCRMCYHHHHQLIIIRYHGNTIPTPIPHYYLLLQLLIFILCIPSYLVIQLMPHLLQLMPLLLQLMPLSLQLMYL